MDGGDMMEVKVYKERGKALKEGGGEKGEEKRRKEKEEHWEKRVNNTTFYVNLVSSGELMESLILTYLLTPTYFSLHLSSGKILCCCLFSPLTNFIDLGEGWIAQPTTLSGLGPPNFLVLTVNVEISGALVFFFFFNVSQE